MLRFQFSRGVLTLRLDLRGFSSVFRLMALAVHDFLHFRIHPAGRTAKSILRRHWLEHHL